MFHRLDERHIAQIVDIQVDQLRGRLAERGLGSGADRRGREHVARVGYDPDFGARPLKRVIQREIADPIALSVLQGEYREGDTITVDASPDGLVFLRTAPVGS